MTQYIPPDSITLRIDDGRVDVPAADILHIKTTKQAGKPMDEGEITLDNDTPHPYTTDAEIDIGDQIIFQRSMDPDSGFGEQAFGEGPFGGYETIGTYMVLDWDIVEHVAGQHDLVLKVADWVYAILNHRVVFYQRSGRPISGTENAILNEVLAENAPEIDRSRLPEISVEIDYYSNGKKLRDVVDELAQFAAYYGSPVAQYSVGEALLFREIDGLAPLYDDPLVGEFGPWNTASESDSLKNQVRITGGLDTNNVDDEQTDFSGEVGVSQNNRLVTQLSTRKSETTRMELYTKGENDPDGDGPRLRLQVSNAANDGPIAPDDTDSDIVSTGSQNTALEPGGWTLFNLGEHVIPERNPWLIVDTQSSDSYPIGTDGSGTPAYRAYFPKRLAAQVPRQESIDATTLKEAHIKNESLVTREAVKARANSYLERHASVPVVVGPLNCQTETAHGIRVGDVVPLDRPAMRATGDFIATKKTSVYDENHLTESVEFQGIDSYV